MYPILKISKWLLSKVYKSICLVAICFIYLKSIWCFPKRNVCHILCSMLVCYNIFYNFKWIICNFKFMLEIQLYFIESYGPIPYNLNSWQYYHCTNASALPRFFFCLFPVFFSLLNFTKLNFGLLWVFPFVEYFSIFFPFFFLHFIYIKNGIFFLNSCISPQFIQRWSGDRVKINISLGLIISYYFSFVQDKNNK